jgi:C-terminal peptidase prc
MNRLIVLTLLAWVLGGSNVRADGPMSEAASRAWAITDVVLARHVDPPARQEMLLAGVKAMALATRGVLPAGMARRISDLSRPDQLATLLDEILASPKVEGGPTNPRLLPIHEGLTPAEVFLEGMIAAVPGGATLMSEKERKVQESFAANLYVGIQVKLGVDEKSKRPVFQEILEGGPAEAAGAKAQDVIEEVDGVSTAGMSLGGVVDRLRGPEGTEVLVRFRRPETNEVFTKPMTRGTLPRATIQGLSPLPGKRWATRFDGPAPIGYLKITEVTGSTPQELRSFAAQLESEGAKALVLDLRQTSPAHFHETVLLADVLLDGGIIGRVRSTDGEKTYRAEPDALFRDWPMVVLAGGNSEPEVAWLCDALLDNHRAKVLGEPAFNREPTFLETISLPGGEWSVRMTTGRLERGDGRPLERRPTKGPAGEALAGMDQRIGDLLVRSKELLVDADKRLFSGQTKDLDALEGFLSLYRANPNAVADSEALKERRRKMSANPATTPAPAARPDHGPDRDLAKAREILAEALKTIK